MTDHHFHDEALRDFVARGYTLIPSDHPPEFHLDVCERLDYVLEKEGNPGNNILPRVPQIQRVFETPSVRSALTTMETNAKELADELENQLPPGLTRLAVLAEERKNSTSHLKDLKTQDASLDKQLTLTTQHLSKIRSSITDIVSGYLAPHRRAVRPQRRSRLWL